MCFFSWPMYFCVRALQATCFCHYICSILSLTIYYVPCYALHKLPVFFWHYICSIQGCTWWQWMQHLLWFGVPVGNNPRRRIFPTSTVREGRVELALVAGMEWFDQFLLNKQRQSKFLGLFHEVTSPVMTGENTIQNKNKGWRLFHRTTSDSDKKLVNCNKVKGKFEPSCKCVSVRHFPISH